MESTILSRRARRSRLRSHFCTSAATASRALPTVASRRAAPAALPPSVSPPPVRDSKDTVGKPRSDGVACGGRVGGGARPSVPGMLREMRPGGPATVCGGCAGAAEACSHVGGPPVFLQRHQEHHNLMRTQHIGIQAALDALFPQPTVSTSCTSTFLCMMLNLLNTWSATCTALSKGPAPKSQGAGASTVSGRRPITGVAHHKH